MSELLIAATLLFNSALSEVNTKYQEQHLPYHIELNQEAIDPKEPIRLKAVYESGEQIPVGVIHLIKVEGDKFDERLASPDFYPAEWEKIALTVDQVKEDMFARVALYFSATKDPHIYVHKSNGQLFNFKDYNVVIAEDDTFTVNGKQILYQGQPLKISRIVSQFVIEFNREENGHILLNKGDKRTGKGIYIDESGNVYRA